MTTSTDYFPLSVATGLAFCNRTDEIATLKYCIESLRPVLLTSPRRYGKTSLALAAIQQTQLPFAHIDFFSAIEEIDIERLILQSVGKLITRMESAPKRALKLAKELFEGTNIRAVVGKAELSIEVIHKKEKPAYNVLDLLEKLEHLARKSGKKIILFFDEFQNVGEVTTNHGMESVLRQVAQMTQAISFIFSGSNRHLLNQMFNDRNRPFYKLCEKIVIERISESAYEAQIQKVAKKKWGSPFVERIIESIFNYSERHPYYLNALCSRLFNKERPPTPHTIAEIWHQYMLEERSSVASELELLSKNQRKLLTVLARAGETSAPLGKIFVHQANMSKATIDQALNFLERKDYVYRDKNGNVKLLDPIIKAVLAMQVD